MESWCFDALDKGFVSNETSVAQSDGLLRSKNVFNGWDFKAPFSYEDSSVLVPDQLSVEKTGFAEEGFAEIMRKQFSSDATRNPLQSNAAVGGGDIVSVSHSLFAVPGDEESSSKVSSSIVESNSRESSLIDLKLGGFGDNLNTNSCRTVPSSAESSSPAKRVRVASLSPQTVFCQVYGCHKDLSLAKDYHKRHKVCDVHSKTSKVVVNGIEQRFCQQCSRFHLLGEFDEGKRSCRKRLAGHNERRRKPQISYNCGRSGRSYLYSGSVGSKFQGDTFSAASFIYQDALPSDLSYSEKYGPCRRVKVEDGTEYAPKSADTCINGEFREKSVLSPFLFGKQYPPLYNKFNNGPESGLGEFVSQQPHEIVSRSLVQMNSVGSEDLPLFDTASTVQGLPGVSESGCALSLLSSQSQNSSGHSSRIPGTHPSIITNSSPHYSMSEVSEKLFGVSTECLASRFQNKYPAHRINSSGRHILSAIPLHENGDIADSGFRNGILQEFTNARNHLSGDGGTIDLLQLSSQLQRVENQRQSTTETEGFCSLRMT